MKILICDNNLEFIHKIRADIEKKLNNEGIEYEIYIKNHDFMQIDHIYDAIFVNVDLGNINGIEVARKIRKLMPKVIIIFVSENNDTVFETLSVGVFQFIRVDHYQQDIMQCLNDMMNYIKNKLQFVMLDIKGRKMKLYLSNIKYILSVGHEVTIYCYDCEICFRSTMAKVLAMLQSHDIIQIQRAIAVHLGYVQDVKKREVQGEDGQFQIGRKYQKDFLTNYENFLCKK